MNTATILIPAALLYSGLLYWIFVRFNLRAVWRGAQAEGAILNGKTLARNLKRALDFLLVFCVFNLIVWPPLLLVMAVSQSMIPTWGIVMPLLQYFAWGSVVKDISFSSPGLQLYPAFELNVMGLLLGFLLIVLSDLLKEAAEMNTEQELTI